MKPSPTLYIRKGAGTPSAGVSPVKDKQHVRSYKESFNTKHSGVANSHGATYDDPKVGKKWPKGEDNSLDDQLEEDRQADNKEAQDRGIVPKDMKKAFDPTATDLLKSFTEEVYSRVNEFRLTPQEVQFLQEVKGYSPLDIQKSQLYITGKDRQLFSDWLATQFHKSLEGFRG